MQRLELNATHKPVRDYYAALRQFDDLGVTHEIAVRCTFQDLLDYCARQHDWTLVPEWEIRRPRQHLLRVDGAHHSLSASNGERARVRCRSGVRPSCLTHAFCEAEDSRDDLPEEARKKFDLGGRGAILGEVTTHE